MEFFLFAALMAIDMLLFIFLASRYTYVDNTDDDVKEENTGDKTLIQKPVTTYASDNDGYNDSAL